MVSRILGACLLIGQLGLPGHTTPTDTAKKTAKPESVSPASPRAAVDRFLQLARDHRFAEAAVYLDLPRPFSRADSVRLARQLQAVLDRYVWIDLDRLSPDSRGDLADGLRSELEQIATIPGRHGTAEPVRLFRSEDAAGDTLWRFSPSTIERIPGWYATLPDRWMLENVPEPLLETGPLDILWWQWMALPILLLVAIPAGYLISRGIAFLLGQLAVRTTTPWDDAMLARVAKPLRWASFFASVALLLPLLDLYAPASATCYRIIRTGFLLVFIWVLWRSVDVIRQMLTQSRWGRTASSSRSLVPLATRGAKVIVVAIGVVAVLSLLGYPVNTLVAGLGLGGLALALAAQKTVENLFGALSIGIDQPFREGDFVKIEDFTGTVEQIGLRSTRFRTLDRTLISIPNGRLAEMRLESYTARDRLRLSLVMGLVYQTTANQVRAVVADVERTLHRHPKVWSEGISVRFTTLGASSLDVQVAAWFDTADWEEFQLIRQELLLQFMEIVERAGTSLAYPTRTVHLMSTADASLSPSPSQQAAPRA